MTWSPSRRPRRAINSDLDQPVVAVANRLPIQRVSGGWQLAPGGLVSALHPVMTQRRGAWVGWDGATRAVPTALPSLDVDLARVPLSATQVRNYLHGFANATLWPLLHNAVERPRFDRLWWDYYRQVNGIFADRAVTALRSHPGALAWVHDYQLMLVPDLLRRRLPEQRIGFFLHVPWPSFDIFARLPWRCEILSGLLSANVISFHTDRYRTNFLRAVRRLLAPFGVEVRGNVVVQPDGHEVTITAVPISIDVAELTACARDSTTDREVALLARQFAGRTVLLGVDRLDYTKGIIERLCAFEQLLDRRPDLRNRVVLLQIAAPTRDEVPAYRELRATVEAIVGRINGRFTDPGSEVPIHYLYRVLSTQQLAAYYAVADTLLVTPLADGMNLVAKEFVTVQHARSGTGALVLSEFTGAADELHGAIRCNPFDIEGLSIRIENAIELDRRQRRDALNSMFRRISSYDVQRWVTSQLRSIGGDEGDVWAGNSRTAS